MEVVTVSQINKYIKSLMDRDTLLSDVTVMGEISNFKRHSSGHYYFSVKDAGATISAAMFKWQNRTLKFMPENGMRVLVHGRISVYEPSGQYQIIADSIEPDGVGALYEAYEKLKRQLEEQGWFAPERKKPLPRFPRKIAVITSPTGAAIRDILNILESVFELQEGPDAAADDLLEVLGHLPFDDAHGLLEPGPLGIEQGEVHDHVAFLVHRVHLLQAAVPAAHAGCHDDENGFLHFPIPPIVFIRKLFILIAYLFKNLLQTSFLLTGYRIARCRRAHSTSRGRTGGFRYVKSDDMCGGFDTMQLWSQS